MTDEIEIFDCSYPVLRLEAIHCFALDNAGRPHDKRVFECGEHFVTNTKDAALVLVQLGLAKVIDL